MRKSAVIDYYKTASAVAAALEISPAAVSKWPEIVPEGSAYKLHVVTGGALDVGADDYQPARRAVGA